MIRYLPIASILLVSLAACKNDIVVDMEFPMENDQWITGQKKVMEFDVSDTAKVYQMDLRLKHSPEYDYQNLYVRILTTFPDGKEQSSVTSLELLNPDGTWAGDCGDSNCTITLPLQQHFTFPETGTYRWAIEPYMRDDTVDGILSLTVTCKKAEE